MLTLNTMTHLSPDNACFVSNAASDPAAGLRGGWAPYMSTACPRVGGITSAIYV